MDLVLDVADHYCLTPLVYPVTWPEDDPWRQLTSLLVICNVMCLALYFLMATFSYYVTFDHRLLKHPQILEVRVMSI